MTNGKRYFSMFTGVGGFELGIGNRAECIGFSEIDRYASQLLATKFPGIKNYEDARNINPTELPEFDILCGGFPCQAFSIAGKRKGFNDTRGTLFFEIARIIEVKRPKHVLLENVKGLLNHEKGQTFSVIIQTLEELGYNIQWMVLNSKFFGVPQNRERVFIVGSLRNEPRPEILPFRKDEELFNQTNESNKRQSQTASTLKDGKLRADNSFIIHNIYGGFGEGIREQKETSPTIRTPKGGGHLPMIVIPVPTPDREEKRQNGRRFKEEGDPSFTLTGQDVHGVAILSHSPRTNDPTKGGSGPLISEEHSFTIDSTPHNVIMGMEIRRLTPLECERLQGFPEGWTKEFSDAQRYKMMGNAVTINVIKAIMEKLCQQK